MPQIEEQLLTREERLEHIKDKLKGSQERMKMFADRKRTEKVFEEGQWVYLKLQPHRQATIAARGFHKLRARYFRPFQITQRIGAVAYRLKLPPVARVHPVFHVSLLKEKIGDIPVTATIPLLWTVDSKEQPVHILERRITKKGGAAAIVWLVQWEDQEAAQATWEDVDDLKKRFPDWVAEQVAATHRDDV